MKPKKKSQKILLTGVTGFVGSELLNCLILAGHDVIAVSRKQVLLNHSVTNTRIENLNSTSDLRSALLGVDVVIHLAARVHVMKNSGAKALAEYRRANVDSTLNLARQSASCGVKRFIFLSSIKVNGEFTSCDDKFTADDVPNPQDPYGVSKLEAELALKELAEETGMEVVIIRPPLVYGPKVKANFLSMMKWLNKGLVLPFGAIRNHRSMVGLDNLVDLIVTCINHPKAANQTFLVSDDYDVSTSTLLKETSTALGKKARLVSLPSFPLRAIFFLIGKRALSQRLLDSLRVDITKTKEMLGWQPPVSFEEGIRRTAKDFLESAYHP